jgi:CRP-like cAMP-binding protein
VIVPNSVISKEAIVNFNEPVRPVRFAVDIGATYAKGPNEVREALLEAVRRSPRALAEPAPVVHLVDFGNSAIVYRVKFWVAEFAEEDAALDEVRTAIYYSFARHGIEIPYPIQIEYSREEAPAALPADAVAAALARVELFAPLGDDARRQLAAGTHERRFGAGEVIVRQGDSGESLFVVHQGEVVVRLEPDGREVARTRPGGVFGEMSLLTGDPRTATVAAACDSVVLEIDAAAFRDVVLTHPEALDAMSRLVVERRAGLDAAHAAARDDAAITAQSRSLLDRMRRFLRL